MSFNSWSQSKQASHSDYVSKTHYYQLCDDTGFVTSMRNNHYQRCLFTIIDPINTKKKILKNKSK